ncbi:hypothetical protein Kpol_1002p17 [Vanderwaltozyma polyspora DSM 70294]|uniref:RNA polymerase II assembly factor Rtp1 C-terminal domain-containing protein n=1 Tax=Vanderwaltozyma polyspora (strain ATCC 22028 / DSM 70294 / BCRC 21397 / CBS 2163 / NBRC 10782 / NRRL Y-8283 / UCD 57-17) TaxID=436907 RepID=A7TE50_VANPO|nr:uncharacterized protein Kpol_1002p17 [Vanderwaltozyma polyspora DSM 70294]EDO19372.1 hypothetical protein Kpol_1002p17 [Vanderwaltozyma polyspora DSM 70294]
MDSNQNTIADLIKKGPDFISDEPLDVYFLKLRDFLEKLNKLDLSSNDSNADGDLYLKWGFQSNEEFVSILLEYFKELYELVLIKQDELLKQEKNLLPLSLHDMRYFDELINLLLIHGIDANILPDSRIPLDQKRLENFKEYKLIYDIPPTHTMNFATLIKVVNYFYKIIIQKGNKTDYVRSILLKGPTFTNMFLAISVLLTNDITCAHIYSKMLDSLEDCQETYQLFVVYSFLVQTVSNPSVKQVPLSKLSTLALRRENGVISLCDFVLGVREEEQISLEKFERVNQILLAKPKDMNNKDYLTKLFEQIYEGLTYINRPVLVNCLNGLVTEFYFRNKRIIKDFLLQKINDVLFNEPAKSHSIKELNDTINILISLSKNSSTELVNFVVNAYDGKKFYLNLWIYALFLKKKQILSPMKDEAGGASTYYEVILSLMKSFFTITDNFDSLETITLNMVNYRHENWTYSIDLETHLAYISLETPEKSISSQLKVKKEDDDSKLDEATKFFQDIDDSISIFIELLKLIADDNVISKIFLNTLSKWVQTSDTLKETLPLDVTANDSALVLVDLKLLEKMNNEFKTDLIKKWEDLLSMVDELLEASKTKELKTEDDKEIDSDDEDEDEEIVKDNTHASGTFETLLELISAVLSTTSPQELMKKQELLESIRGKLVKSMDGNSDCEALIEKLNKILSGEKVGLESEIPDINAQERLDKAMLNLSDPLLPIKVHGLQELLELVESKSNVITLDKVLQLHMQYLRNPDPYVYLNIIKGLSKLLQLDSDKTLPELIEFYDNKKGRNKLDDILKVGEVFIKYIETENELFAGKKADMIITACLNKIRQHSKLDDRIRMSATSILGVCLQVNARGISDRISDMLDCAFGILQLETDTKSSNLMRRAAIHMMHDLMYNAGFELFPREYSPERIKTLLEYTELNDDDFLVCEQAHMLLEVME